MFIKMLVPVQFIPLDQIIARRNYDPMFKVQHYLSDSVENAIIAKFKDGLNNNRLSWFTSISDKNASSFLTVLPKNPTFTFNNDAFTALLNHRMYLPQPRKIHGQRCTCNKKNIDSRAHHCIKRDEAGKSDRAAKIRFKYKINKYDTISKACQLKFYSCNNGTNS